MRILFIHQMFNLPDAPGGTWHFELFNYCVKQGHHFSIVASDLNYKTGEKVVQNIRLITEDTVEDLHILRAYTYPSLHRSFIWREWGSRKISPGLPCSLRPGFPTMLPAR